MAVAAEQLAALDARQAAEQATLAEQVALVVLAYWLLVDTNQLSGPAGVDWARRSLLALESGFRRSASIAQVFSGVTRRLYFPDEPVVQPPIAAAPTEEIKDALRWAAFTQTIADLKRTDSPAGVVASETDASRALELLGRARSQVGARAQPESEVQTRAAVRIVGSALVKTTDGARAQVDAIVAADPKARGYVRTTQAGCCYFCALLASRGPVYKDDSFEASNARFEGPGQHKVHDHCRCGMRPVYSNSMTEWPEDSLRFSDQWFNAKKGRTPAEDIYHFRRLYEGRTDGRQLKYRDD